MRMSTQTTQTINGERCANIMQSMCPCMCTDFVYALPFRALEYTEYGSVNMSQMMTRTLDVGK